MDTKIIKIGNSKGIIIPSKFLKLIGIEEKVVFEIEDDKLIIKPSKTIPREGWENIISEDIEEYGQPKKLIPDFFENNATKDWEW